MTYSHMGNPHTTIGDASFHFRVRYGIGWFQRSMVTRQILFEGEMFIPASGIQNLSYSTLNSTRVGNRFARPNLRLSCFLALHSLTMQEQLSVRVWLQLSLPKSLWRYMVKPLESLVLVSSTPHNAYTPSLSTS